MDNVVPSSECVTAVITRFRQLLNSSWSSFNEIMTAHDWDNDPYFIDDWLQANWDLLVCRQLVGQGAIQQFGITPRDAAAIKTPFKLCVDADAELTVLSIVGKPDDSYGLYPDFDFVAVADSSGNLEYMPIGGLRFKLVARAH